MSTRERITQDLDELSEVELKQVAEYLAFLKYKTRFGSEPVFDEQKIADLYAEFADEDRKLAEEGMEDYNHGLANEDAG